KRAVGGCMGPWRAQAGERRREGGGAGDVEVHRLRRPLPFPSCAGAGEGWRQGGRAGDACYAPVSAADAEFLLFGAAPATAEERDPGGCAKLKRGASAAAWHRWPRHPTQVAQGSETYAPRNARAVGESTR